MVVGEPSLMGGEFGEEDERLISRLENAQYDPAAAAAQAAATHSGNLGGPTGGPQGGLGGQNMCATAPPPGGPPHMSGQPQGMDSNFGTGPSGWSSSGSQGARSSSAGTPGPVPSSGSNNGNGTVGSMPGPGGQSGSGNISSVNQGPNSGGSLPAQGQIVPKTEPDLNKSPPSNC